MDLVASFAYDAGKDGDVHYYHDGGHGDLEEAFSILGDLGLLIKKPGKMEHYYLDYDKLEGIDGD